MIERLRGDKRRATMRAVWYDRQGAADEVFVCGELPTPEAGDGEVRVRLEASGVNPSDTYRRRGPPAMEYPRVTNRGIREGPEIRHTNAPLAAARCPPRTFFSIVSSCLPIFTCAVDW